MKHFIDIQSSGYRVTRGMRNAKEAFVGLKLVGMRNTAANLSVTPTLQNIQRKKAPKFVPEHWNFAPYLILD